MLFDFAIINHERAKSVRCHVNPCRCDPPPIADMGHFHLDTNNRFIAFRNLVLDERTA